MGLFLDNHTMRRLWLDTNGLLAPANDPLNLLAIIKKLGFIQLDTIQNVSRAHHHILWTRHPRYREHMLDEMLAAQQYIFEHFTHDAAVLPMEFYPIWKRQFRRFKQKFETVSYHNPQQVQAWKSILLTRITAEGPLSTKNFDSQTAGPKKAWSRPPHKHVLDYLWYTGRLATSHREKFHKFYDLAERVIPARYLKNDISDAEQIDWLCRAALKRLAVGTPKEIREFWAAKEIREVENWIRANQKDVITLNWEAADGRLLNAFALSDIETRLENLPATSRQMKIINPFDPAIRDRVRLKKIFGFDYKLEVFVPAAKRRWGYYVYPLLEGERFIGRLEAKADRKSGCLNILNLWPEPQIKWGNGRQKKLHAELMRFARLAGLNTVSWRSQSTR